MFPGAHAQVYYNEAGEPTGWDYPSDDGPSDDDYLNWNEANEYRDEYPDGDEYDLDDDELEDDELEDAGQCKGHENLDSEYRGDIVYCDGSCR